VNHYGAKQIIAQGQRYMISGVSVQKWNNTKQRPVTAIENNIEGDKSQGK